MLHEPIHMTTEMGISERLDHLRRANPEVDTAVFFDVRAGTVLCMSAFANHPQEKMDGIVSTSARLFDGRFGNRKQFTLATAIEVLVVQMVENNMALALIFEPGVDLDVARMVARDAGSEMQH